MHGGNFSIVLVKSANFKTALFFAKVCSSRSNRLMNIGIIGATGNIGRRVLVEGIRRGHHITAFTRDKTHISKIDRSDGVVWKEVNVLDSTSLEPAIAGLDVLVSTYQPGNASRDFNDTVQRSINDPRLL
jgi:putative NADH-flavin reductase